MEKPVYLYKAITESIQSWGDRHYINARQHLAPLLGLRGKNAAIQLSNMLNYKSYNPRDPKPMKLAQLCIILDEIDAEDVAHVLNALGDRDGLIAVPKNIVDGTPATFHGAIDRAMLESGDVFRAGKFALSEETLSAKSLRKIISEIEEAEAANAKLKAMARQRLEEMGETL